MKILLLQILFICPLIALLLQSVTYPFLSFRFSEKWIQGIMKVATFFALAAAACLIFNLGTTEKILLFDLIPILVSPLNCTLALFGIVIMAVVTTFSFDYIHKEIGFYKFFLNLNLFWLGQTLFIWSESYLYIFAGWEFIGISSIFLISYYDYRIGPVKNSLVAMGYFKLADIVLISSFLLLNYLDIAPAHTTFNIEYIAYTGIVVAGLIKSGSFPFTIWLPKAMEGPTPSSAVYYAALSVITGVTLILKYAPMFLQYPVVQNVLMITAILTILYSSLVSRIQTDAKKSLVYATSAQLGFVLLEISFGYYKLAVFHMISSSIIKTYQFLRTPSYLYMYHGMEGGVTNGTSQIGFRFDSLLPKSFRTGLYKLTYNHFYLDDLIHLVTSGSMKLSKYCKYLLNPIITFDQSKGWSVLFWLAHLGVALFFVNANSVQVKENFIEFVPLFLLGVSLAMLRLENVYEFVGSFVVYKILESLILHTVHAEDQYKVLGAISVVLFMFLVMLREKLVLTKKKLATAVLVNSLILVLMLYFTNFPFLLQSLINKHLIDHYVSNGNYSNLIVYGLANTFFNIGVFRFIFKFIYMHKRRELL